MKLFQSKSSKEDVSDETKKCGECLVDIPRKAKKCSHCGSKQKQEYTAKHLLYALILIIFVVVVFSSGGNDSPSAPTEPLAPTESQTYITAKSYVENVLKAPSTADFPTLGTVRKLDGEDKYVVYGYVDSENSFGAMIRSDWEVRLKYLGGDWVKDNSWELEYINVE